MERSGRLMGADDGPRVGNLAVGYGVQVPTENLLRRDDSALRPKDTEHGSPVREQHWGWGSRSYTGHAIARLAMTVAGVPEVFRDRVQGRRVNLADLGCRRVAKPDRVERADNEPRVVGPVREFRSEKLHRPTSQPPEPDQP